jgi:S-formylglutathione hydrolase FrmB
VDYCCKEKNRPRDILFTRRTDTDLCSMLAAAAAAAAAEAAARDAAETEAQQGGDAVLSVAMSAMGGDEVDTATLRQDPYGHEHQLGGYEATRMAVEPVSEVGMDHLLQQMVAEQQQVEREQHFREQLAAAAVAEAARLNRPQEHFITIASNGECHLVHLKLLNACLISSKERIAHRRRC